MNSAEHKTESEKIIGAVNTRWVEFAGKVSTDIAVKIEYTYLQTNIALAQVHATLATIPDEPVETNTYNITVENKKKSGLELSIDEVIARAKGDRR